MGWGLSLCSRLGITGLGFLLEQNNYNLHRGPEFSTSTLGSQLKNPSSEAQVQFYLELDEQASWGHAASRVQRVTGAPEDIRSQPLEHGNATFYGKGVAGVVTPEILR